jgi:maltose alpha-D-glucosyltransferase / alpha-amylase
VRFERVPPYVGSVSWRSPDGATYAIALGQGFVANVGDGWTWMLQRLTEVQTGDLDLQRDQFAAERLLGRRTGELHVALGAIQEPTFAPETTDRADIDDDIRRTSAAIEETILLLQERKRDLPEHLKTRLPEAIAGLRALAKRVDGYWGELNTLRIRVHGDYHLGQTLRTPDGDWAIIDFEGEPARPLEERRQRASVLKDVAGMLRSFAYAAAVGSRAESREPSAERVADWERGTREAYLHGYFSETRGRPGLLPRSRANAERLITLFELEKSFYELQYELDHRPDWVWVPLRGITQLLA